MAEIDDRAQGREREREVVAASVAAAREQAARLSEMRQAEDDRLHAEGLTIDPLDALARCFTAGNSGTESLRGDGSAH